MWINKVIVVKLDNMINVLVDEYFLEHIFFFYMGPTWNFIQA